jgi:hypothetical protein
LKTHEEKNEQLISSLDTDKLKALYLALSKNLYDLPLNSIATNVIFVSAVSRRNQH